MIVCSSPNNFCAIHLLIPTGKGGGEVFAHGNICFGLHVWVFVNFMSFTFFPVAKYQMSIPLNKKERI